MRLFKKPNIHVYESLVALFVTTLIISNIVSIKLVTVGPFTFDAGTILFPLAYIIGDIISEVYGFRKMRSILLTGIGMLVLTTTTFWAVGALPAASDWTNQAAYDSVLGVVWRIAAASVIAIFLGELLNAYVLAKLKIRSKGKQLWNRLIASSAVGSLVDTVVFSLIAFWGVVDGSTLLNIILTVYGIKLATEIAVSPLTIRVIESIKNSEKIDTFEEPHLLPVTK